ncbi:class I SAM-dependent methyltransferase [Candidatus Woesearchaeota archaeon]|nr:class I SAM-dependent methyltransferase [Candidatus Woesearchaeota archaeon]
MDKVDMLLENKKEEPSNAQVWNELSEEFNTYKKEMFYGAADNIHTAWPVILGYVKKNISGNSLRALDFGCGTGMFCRELKSLGFDTTGIDISEKMVEIAKKHNKDINFFVGEAKKAVEISSNGGKLNLITSIMALQFVQDIEECIKIFSDSLTNDGHIIFAVHNPAKLDENGIKEDFNVGNTGKIVKIFKRTANDYDKIFKKLSFKKTLGEYPKTSPEFLERYGQKDSLKIPKYMILAYKKTG